MHIIFSRPPNAHCVHTTTHTPYNNRFSDQKPGIWPETAPSDRNPLENNGLMTQKAETIHLSSAMRASTADFWPHPASGHCWSFKSNRSRTLFCILSNIHRPQVWARDIYSLRHSATSCGCYIRFTLWSMYTIYIHVCSSPADNTVWWDGPYNSMF